MRRVARLSGEQPTDGFVSLRPAHRGVTVSATMAWVWRTAPVEEVATIPGHDPLGSSVGKSARRRALLCALDAHVRSGPPGTCGRLGYMCDPG